MVDLGSLVEEERAEVCLDDFAVGGEGEEGGEVDLLPLLLRGGGGGGGRRGSGCFLLLLLLLLSLPLLLLLLVEGKGGEDYL